MTTDFYDISALLNDEQRMIRDTVRDFVMSEVLPIIEEHNQAMTFPMELISKIGALGLQDMEQPMCEFDVAVSGPFGMPQGLDERVVTNSVELAGDSL